METNNTNTARGMGRYYARIGVRQGLAVQYTVTRFPQLAGLEAAIKAGWHAERFGR